jgi:hypothetical protein
MILFGLGCFLAGVYVTTVAILILNNRHDKFWLQLFYCVWPIMAILLSIGFLYPIVTEMFSKKKPEIHGGDI